jgi:nitrite reductase/ring-hydroxylating ferredoxin subunit
MQRVALALVCAAALAYEGLGNRIQTRVQSEEADVSHRDTKNSDSLTTLLYALNPAGRVNPSTKVSATLERARRPVMGGVATNNKWVTFAETSDLVPGETIQASKFGQEVGIVCTQGGKLFAVINKLPPTGQPSTQGIVKGDTLSDTYTGSTWDLKTGKTAEWCKGPLGSLILGRLFPVPQDIDVFPVRKQGKNVQVNINVNAKAQFEETYWRGILDAQGKVDGGYY